MYTVLVKSETQVAEDIGNIIHVCLASRPLEFKVVDQQNVTDFARNRIALIEKMIQHNIVNDNVNTEY